MPIASPPPDYALDRPGASGVPVGPALRICDEGGEALPAGSTGRIHVRGCPLMDGYLEAGAGPMAGRGGGVEEGRRWFDTGDVGQVDGDGWVYITGRSKEIINRGGETVAPMEVEEALAEHDRVAAVLAFAAPHAILQEVVGVVIVPAPGRPRVDLATLQRHAAGRLHPSKWPQVVVYLPGLPRGPTNKAQRVRLAERMCLAAVGDRDPPQARHFEGDCPPAGSGLQLPIPIWPVPIDPTALEEALRVVLADHGAVDYRVLPSTAGGGQTVAYVKPATADCDGLMEALRCQLHGYLMPSCIKACDQFPLDAGDDSGGVEQACTPTEETVLRIWTEELGQPCGLNDDFFERGGDSLAGGRLIARLRKECGAPLTAAVIFSRRTVSSLAAAVDEYVQLQPSAPAEGQIVLQVKDIQTDPEGAPAQGAGRLAARSATAGAPLLAQALPFLLFQPVRRLFSWLIFIYAWVHLLRIPSVGKAGAFILAILLARCAAAVILPLIAIAGKWAIIGRYMEGRYALWGGYYLRWWIVDQLCMACGRGAFELSGMTIIWYYRLMGARVGRGAAIDKRVLIADFDLVDIASGAVVEGGPIRAFCFESGCMALRPVHIGHGATVCFKAIVAPGAKVPAGASVGPLSSTHQLLPDTSEEDRALCCSAFTKPTGVLRAFGLLLILLVWMVELSPVVGLLAAMSLMVRHLVTYTDVLTWFVEPGRIGIMLAMQVCRVAVCPLLRVACCVAVKRLVIGRFEAGPRQRSNFVLFQHWLMRELLPSEKLQVRCRDCARIMLAGYSIKAPAVAHPFCLAWQEASHLLGVHYEGVSWLMRMLGAKVGSRVYWPGSGIERLVEYDLLEVGDDVVFGSRSAILCADSCCAAPVVISAGANVADRCVLLPGTVVGRCAVLGSGTLAPRSFVFPPGSVWVGSRAGQPVLLSTGDNEAAESEETTRAFGRAMYQGIATYWVLPYWLQGAVAASFICIAAMSAGLTRVASLMIAKIILKGLGSPWMNYFWIVVAIMLLVSFAVEGVVNVLAVSGAVGFKWLLIGRRKEGQQDWDTSPYCQRWQLYLSSLAILRVGGFGPGRVLDSLRGSAYLVWYFRALGAKVGQNVCLYPTGGDPMMTEPELVSIGDGACVDDASLVAHLNSRGRFELRCVTIGARSTLRRASRVLAGAAVHAGGTLLEHTLVMSGDAVDSDTTWQGWPADVLRKDDPRLAAAHVGSVPDFTVEPSSTCFVCFKMGRPVVQPQLEFYSHPSFA